ncbi:MAG: restriction endonuclease subunit S [Blastocatellia bacterium]|nr:restriction endonuclease subunit S [Blastocatellia bacterium]
MAWRKTKLVNVAAKKRWALNGGPFGSKLSRKHYSESGVPVIRGTNLSSSSCFTFDDFVYVSEEKADELRANNAHPGDLIFTQRGTIGQVGLIPFNSPIPRFVISQSQMKLTPDPEQADAFFLYHFFSAAETVQEIQNLAFAAGVPHINLEILRNFEVPLPPLRVQRRIAGILSTYDELMENCQRRIRILEGMARVLYREWFIHFRFPGHEKIPRIDSVLGPIPKEWEAIPFERLLASLTGGDWGSDQSSGSDTSEVGIVRGTDFDEVAYGGQLRVPVRYIKPSSLKTRGLRVGDVIIENSINAKSRCIGTTLLVDSHVLNRLGRDAVAASFCKVFRLHDPRLAPLVHLHVRRLREDARMEYYQNVAANGIGNFQAQKFAKEEHLILPADESLRAKLIDGIATMFRNIAVFHLNCRTSAAPATCCCRGCCRAKSRSTFPRTWPSRRPPHRRLPKRILRARSRPCASRKKRRPGVPGAPATAILLPSPRTKRPCRSTRPSAPTCSKSSGRSSAKARPARATTPSATWSAPSATAAPARKFRKSCTPTCSPPSAAASLKTPTAPCASAPAPSLISTATSSNSNSSPPSAAPGSTATPPSATSAAGSASPAPAPSSKTPPVQSSMDFCVRGGCKPTVRS